jgi:uncharacterized protein (TIGR03546 family)
MIILVWIRKIYKALSADASPSAIAFALAFGLTLGFVPLTSGVGLCLLLALLIFRVQLSMGLLAWAAGGLLRLGLSGLFFSVGDALLEAEPLRGFWTWFLNLPVVYWLKLDYPAILGGAVTGVVLGAALFVPVRLLVLAYRKWAHDRLSQNKFFRWATNLWLIRLLRFVFIGATP